MHIFDTFYLNDRLYDKSNKFLIYQNKKYFYNCIEHYDGTYTTLIFDDFEEKVLVNLFSFLGFKFGKKIIKYKYKPLFGYHINICSAKYSSIEVQKILSEGFKFYDRKQEILNNKNNIMSNKQEIYQDLENKYYPFISEVEKFNSVMGKSNLNKQNPEVGDKMDYEFVYNFILEELEEYKESCINNDIIGIADALGDIMYVLCNGILNHGLKKSFNSIYQEIQSSNLSKSCKTEDEAKKTCIYVFNNKGWECYYEYNKQENLYIVYRKSDRKVMKSINFFPPNLKQFLG